MIGILDSGVGGLSVLQEIHALLPQEDLIYVGDSAFCPYGTKSTTELRQRIGRVVEFLLEQGAQAIVLACNSATIQAVQWCRERWPEISFVGMEPGVKPAIAATKSGTIGVLATEASLTGEMFRQLVAQYRGECQVLTRPCPRFVDLVEDGQLLGEEVTAAVRDYAGPLVAAGADVLVLGCTHYHFLKDEIARLFPQLLLVDTGAAVARRVKGVLEPLENGATEEGAISYYTSGCPEIMERLLRQLVPKLPDKVAQFAL